MSLIEVIRDRLADRRNHDEFAKEFGFKSFKDYCYNSGFADAFDDCKNGYAQWLAARLGSPNERLADSALLGRFDAVKTALKDGADIHYQEDTALRGAAAQGHTEIVDFLLDNGANIHARNDQALSRSVYHGFSETAIRLLARGADATAFDDPGLFKAVSEGPAAIRALCKERIEYFFTNPGTTRQSQEPNQRRGPTV